jgi:serine protease
VAGETLRYTASGLPPGLSVSAAGTVTGTVKAAAAPAKAVTYKVTVSAADAAGATGTVAFSWQVAPA